MEERREGKRRREIKREEGRIMINRRERKEENKKSD